MGKKRRQKKSGLSREKNQESFSNMVGKANKEALKKYVDEQIDMLAMHLQRNLLNQMSSTQLRLTALEQFMMERVEVSEDELRERIAKLEDDAIGFVESSEGAKKGDTLRATIRVKTESQEEFGPEQRMRIENLAKEPFTVNAKFEDQLLGLKKGEEKELSLDDNGSKTLVKVRADKVTMPKQEESKEETSNEG